MAQTGPCVVWTKPATLVSHAMKNHCSAPKSQDTVVQPMTVRKGVSTRDCRACKTCAHAPAVVEVTCAATLKCVFQIKRTHGHPVFHPFQTTMMAGLRKTIQDRVLQTKQPGWSQV